MTGSMAVAGFAALGNRRLPDLFAAVAAIQCGDLIVQAFVWHAAPILLEAQGAIAGLFVFCAVGLYWDQARAGKARRPAAEFL
jgi:hypothetical protein